MTRVLLGILVVCTTTIPTHVSAQDRVISPDSAVSVVLPAGFQPLPLMPGVALQFGDLAAELYVIVMLESRTDMAMRSVEQYGALVTKRMMSRLEGSESTEPESLVLNGRPAVRSVLRGTTANLPVVYVHTTIESPTFFTQVVTWGLASRWESTEEILKGFAASAELMDSIPNISTDAHDIVPGTWAWESRPDPCSDDTQRFVIADDRATMQIHHSTPYENDDGTWRSVTDYVLEGSRPRILHTYIPDETRLTDAGEPVKWDLVVLARNRLAWHRTDWAEGGVTGMLRRCH